MNRLLGKTVLITGASAGIGAACAKEFARSGSNLVLAARRIQRLQALSEQISQEFPEVKIHCDVVDVRDKSAVEAFMSRIPDNLCEIDVLVNNAGMVEGVDKVEDVTSEAVSLMIDTNIKGALNFIQAVIPSMRRRNTGHVINMGSVAGIEAYAGGGMYCATKHALDAITRSLRFETMDTGIRISEIKPGMVETEFSVVRFKGDNERAKKVYEGMEPLEAHDIAELVTFVAGRPPNVNVADLLVFPTAQAAATTVYRKHKNDK